MDEERARILKMIETGSISAEQGLALMNALDEGGQTGQESSLLPASACEPLPGLAERWQRACLYVLYAGVGGAMIGAWLLYAMYIGGPAWWGVCGWPVFAVGVLATALGAWSRTARWLHLRVRRRKERLAISLPLPLELAAWTMKIGQHFMPEKFKATGMDEVIMGLDDSLHESGGPFYVEVSDEEDGEHVQVYIG